MSDVEALQAKRAAREAKKEESRRVQYAKDLVAIDEYEEKHGCELDISLRVQNFREGLPSLVGVKTPEGVYYKRFVQDVQRAKTDAAKTKALESLAEHAWAYPAKEDPSRAALLEAMPGVLLSIGGVAVRLCEVRENEEGKD